MSASVLSARSTRRIARSTGLDILRAWSNGGYTMAFVTADHRHGWWDKKTGDWELYTGDVMHYSSCDALFPRHPFERPPMAKFEVCWCGRRRAEHAEPKP
ncbi:MAG TPA: hypothetical protein VE465_02140 [Streptosporangiaceae bacterium]|jgi:hypothetical protein|nr:hypothetical protein [Streptosporangiaceae bacterium]